MQREPTLRIAERIGRPGLSVLLGAGVLLGVAVVPAATPSWADAILSGAAVVAWGAAAVVGRGLRRLANLPLQLAPVASRGTSRGQKIFRFRAQLGHGRMLTDPVATVTWHAADGTITQLEPWVPANALWGPFTLLATDTGGVVEGEGAFVVRLQVRSAGRSWSAEQRISASAITEGPFDGVRVDRRSVRFTERWQEVTGPLETDDR